MFGLQVVWVAFDMCKTNITIRFHKVPGFIPLHFGETIVYDNLNIGLYDLYFSF